MVTDQGGHVGQTGGHMVTDRTCQWRCLNERVGLRLNTPEHIEGIKVELTRIGDEDEWVFHNPAITKAIERKFDAALDVHDEGRGAEAEKLIRAVAVECPNHIDALQHIGLFLGERGAALESYVFCQAAVAVGLHAIPATFRWERDRIPWNRLPNRPFLRAYYTLGIHRVEQGAWHEATAIFTRILAINPNDNQGLRLVLPECWFETNDVAAVVEHCQRYAGDQSPEILYSKALALAILKRTKEARATIDEGVAARPLVARELLRSRHVEPERKYPGSITVGGADEAWEYWRNYGEYWRKSKLAMTLLREAIGKRSGGRHAGG